MSSYWDLAASIAIAASPAALHIIDKILENVNVSSISVQTLRALMSKDHRVSDLAENENKFEAIRGYFDFERDCHFVFVLSIFNIMRLYVTQAQFTGSWLRFFPATFLLMVAIIIFLFVFLIMLLNGKVEAASSWATDWWRRPILVTWWKVVALLAFGLVIVTEVIMHFRGTGA